MEKEKYTRPSEELGRVELGDKRLTERLEKSTAERMQGVAQGRSSAKGFYRLLGNEKFDSEKLHEAAIEATIERMRGMSKVLVVQDWTDINLSGHKKTKGLGYSSNKTKGIKTHSCLAISTEGVPLGILCQKYDTRAEAKNCISESGKKARPTEEKESYRWIETFLETKERIPANIEAITVCDREGDIFELYEQVQALKSDFVIRVSYDRKTETTDKVLARIRKAPVLGYGTIDVPRDTERNRKARKAQVVVSSCSVRISKKKNSLSLNLVRIFERGQTEEPIEWILATSLLINTSEDAMTVVQYYTQRWKIERFHYVLKSGCKVEEIQQRSYERILPVVFICSMIANFILAMTYLGQTLPDISCELFLEEDEWKLLHRFAMRSKIPPDKPYSLAKTIELLGKLGVGSRAPSDGHYGVKAIWTGLKIFYSSFDILMGQV